MRNGLNCQAGCSAGAVIAKTERARRGHFLFWVWTDWPADRKRDGMACPRVVCVLRIGPGGSTGNDSDRNSRRVVLDRLEDKVRVEGKHRKKAEAAPKTKRGREKRAEATAVLEMMLSLGRSRWRRKGKLSSAPSHAEKRNQ